MRTFLDPSPRFLFGYLKEHGFRDEQGQPPLPVDMGALGVLAT